MGNVTTKSHLLMNAERAELEQSYEDARDLYLQAMKYVEPYSEEMATCHDRLGCLLVRSGDLTGALVHFKNALDIKHEIDPGSSSIAKTLSNIAAVYSGRGEHEKALIILDECLSIRERENPDSLKLAKTLGNIAVILSQLERYHDAIRFHEKAFEIKKHKSPDSISMATTCVNLANLYMRADPSQSIYYLKRAKIIAETSRPVPYTVLADIFTVTGHILRHADIFDDAIDMYEKAIAFERKIMPHSSKIAHLNSEIFDTKLQEVETAEQIKQQVTIELQQESQVATDEESSRLSESLESSRLSEFMNESAKDLLAMPTPNLAPPPPPPPPPLQPLPYPVAFYNLESAPSSASLAPPGYGNISFGKSSGHAAIPFQTSFAHENTSTPSYMGHIPHVQSMPIHESGSSSYVGHTARTQSLSALPEREDDGPDCHQTHSFSVMSEDDRQPSPGDASDGDTLDFLVSLADRRTSSGQATFETLQAPRDSPPPPTTKNRQQQLRTRQPFAAAAKEQVSQVLTPGICPSKQKKPRSNKTSRNKGDTKPLQTKEKHLAQLEV